MCGPTGQKGIEALAARELNITLLQIARGNVVKTGVTEHEGENIFGIAELRAAAPDDHGELAFVLHFLRIFRQGRSLPPDQ